VELTSVILFCANVDEIDNLKRELLLCQKAQEHLKQKSVTEVGLSNILGFGSYLRRTLNCIYKFRSFADDLFLGCFTGTAP
jgi:hypothetical protein